jgi:hypothetical protein
MKIYLEDRAPSTLQNSLTRIGVEYTADINEAVTNAVHITDNFPLDLTGKADSDLECQSYGNKELYVRKKNNLPTCDIRFRNFLSDKLRELNLPNADTIYPTSAEQVQTFFNTHSSVIIKPLLEQKGTPGGISYGFNVYTSYNDFIADIDITQFISSQNNHQVTANKKCILQSTVENRDNTWSVFGVVNGNQQYYFDNISFYNNSESSTTYFNSDNALNISAMTNGAKDPSKENLDQYGISESIKTLLNASNVKNTVFYVSGLMKDGQIYIQYITTKVIPWFVSTGLESTLDSYLKFAFDMESSVTPLNKWRLYLHAKLKPGLVYNSEIVNAAKALKLYPAYVYSDKDTGTFHAMADSLEELLSNISSFNSIYQI